MAESENSKLQVGDIGQIVAFIPRFPLLVRNIERDGILFGTSYTAGRVSGLTEVAVLEQV